MNFGARKICASALICALLMGAAAPSRSPYANVKFTSYEVVDHQLGNLPIGMFAVPEGWHARSAVEWRWGDVSLPVRASARIEANDGSAWVESFPSELFFWLAPYPSNVGIGASSLGMIHAPNIGMQDAMRYVIGRYRGRAQNLQLVGYRQIQNLPAVLHKPASPGEAIGVRIRYTVNQTPVDEEFYALLTPVQRIPYTGPQGTTYEMHRTLLYVHSLGGTGGKLDQMHPLLGFVAASFKPNGAWQQRSAQVYQMLSQRFSAYIAQGYAQIQAAGELSRAISTNNDAMIRSMDTQRAASNAAAAQRRAAAGGSGNGGRGNEPGDAFDQSIRGTERMEDPYWGTSEQSSQFSYHWTDGYGNYQHSNDGSFDPNVGGTQNWQLMQPSK